MGTETNTQPLIPNQPSPSDLAPVEQGSEIDPIRTETIFSRMPLHVLSKSGPRPQINIEKRSRDGRIEERWKVSYNEEYGPAKQLAYDIHTLVIERAIEEAFDEARRTGQPFPRLIPLSSLNDVANRLGPSAETRNTNRIKKALSQNAGILITAFKRYRGSDGEEYTIEGVFTPYGIFFFGQKLPGGERADQVYVNLNDAYFEAWSRSASRPLDYSYKAQLPPIPRRFYELVSYAIYGAIKKGQPTARYRYSEFCKNAPQLRYDTFDQVKKQMYKIHKPHVDANYILRVKYEQTTDEQGRADWWMIYCPGARAYAEFAVFTGKKPPRMLDAAAQSGAGERSKSHAPRQKRLALQPEVDSDELAALMGRGVNETTARKLLADLPDDFPTLDTLEWGDQQIATSGGKITNPPGFYISLLKARTTPPPTFEPSRVRKARQGAILSEQQAAQEAEEKRQAEDRLLDIQLDELRAKDPAQYSKLYEQVRTSLFAEFPKMAAMARTNPDSAIHEGAIRARMKQLIQQNTSHANEPPRAVSPLQDSARSAFAKALQTILTTPQLSATAKLRPDGPQPVKSRQKLEP